MNRRNIQPGAEFAEHSLGGFVRQLEIAAQASSVDDLFARLEAEQLLLRIDADVQPTMYRCATVTPSEVESLQSITDVVRLGRVMQIDIATNGATASVVLEFGERSLAADAIFVDCTADGLERRPVVPVFGESLITLQPVRTCQQVFSAAFIAHVEVAYQDRDEKNGLALVVPHPNTHLDWLRVTLRSGVNSARWRQDEALVSWLKASRLDAFSEMRGVVDVASENGSLLARANEAAIPAMVNLQQFLDQDADA